MLGKPQNYVGKSCLKDKDNSPEKNRRRVFKIVCGLKGPKEPRVEYQDLLWEDCSFGLFGQADDPDARRLFTINHFILADDAIENITPFR